MASDLVVITLSSIALAAGRPAFRRWKADVRQRAHALPDPKLEAFVQSQIVKVFRWGWVAIVAAMLLVAVWNFLTQL